MFITHASAVGNQEQKFGRLDNVRKVECDPILGDNLCVKNHCLVGNTNMT